MPYVLRRVICNITVLTQLLYKQEISYSICNSSIIQRIRIPSLSSFNKRTTSFNNAVILPCWERLHKPRYPQLQILQEMNFLSLWISLNCQKVRTIKKANAILINLKFLFHYIFNKKRAHLCPRTINNFYLICN